MKEQTTTPNQVDQKALLNDPILNKTLGVAMKGENWTTLIALLHHCLTDEETVKALFDDQEQYGEVAFVLASLQRQVFLIQGKIEKPEEEGFAKKILSFGRNKLVAPNGDPLL